MPTHWFAPSAQTAQFFAVDTSLRSPCPARTTKYADGLKITGRQMNPTADPI